VPYLNLRLIVLYRIHQYEFILCSISTEIRQTELCKCHLSHLSKQVQKLYTYLTTYENAHLRSEKVYTYFTFDSQEKYQKSKDNLCF